MYPCTHAPVQVKQRNLTLCEGADPAGDAHFEQGMRLFCRSQEARSCPSRRIHRFRSLCVAARVSAAAAGRAACLRSSESLILPQHTQHLPRRIAANRTAQRTGDAGRPPVGAGGSGAGSRPRGGARGRPAVLAGAADDAQRQASADGADGHGLGVRLPVPASAGAAPPVRPAADPGPGCGGLADRGVRGGRPAPLPAPASLPSTECRWWRTAISFAESASLPTHPI